MTYFFNRLKNKGVDKKGFTLIELLIVMAILGVLAVVVLVAINPVQQLARTRDTGRKSGVTQIGHALEAFYSSRNGTYVPETAGAWVTELVNSGDLSIEPSLIKYGIASINQCVGTAGSEQNGWCYDATDATGFGPAIVFARLESTIEISKCSDPTTDGAWFVYSTEHGRAGLICTANAIEPTVPLGADPWNPTQ